LSFKLPYIVQSRMSNELVQRLLADNHPILVEGIHSTGFLMHRGFEQRRIALRLHNIEHIYYAHLEATAKSPIKRLYYKTESCLLRRYEQMITGRIDTVFSVSYQDLDYCRHVFGVHNVKMLPVFTGFPFEARPGTGCFCLYHGNLAVEENEAAVDWLLEHVFSRLEVPFIIAGKEPSSHLKRNVLKHHNVSLIGNPSHDVLHDLMVKAQVHVIPSANQTGVKLKLIHALHSGRHCVVNNAAVRGSGLEDWCAVADDPQQFREMVWTRYHQPMTYDELEKRRLALQRMFDISCQTREITRWLS
jgi:hypothetical protein